MYLENALLALLGHGVAVELTEQALDDTALAGLDVAARTVEEVLAGLDERAIDAHVLGRVGHLEQLDELIGAHGAELADELAAALLALLEMLEQTVDGLAVALHAALAVRVDLGRAAGGHVDAQLPVGHEHLAVLEDLLLALGLDLLARHHGALQTQDHARQLQVVRVVVIAELAATLVRHQVLLARRVEGAVDTRIVARHQLPASQLLRARLAHHRVELVLGEALVDASLAAVDLLAEAFAVVAAREEQRSVHVEVVGLELGDAQYLLLAGQVELAELEAEALDGAALLAERVAVVGRVEAAALVPADVVLAVGDEVSDETVVAEHERTDVRDELLAAVAAQLVLVAQQARRQVTGRRVLLALVDLNICNRSHNSIRLVDILFSLHSYHYVFDVVFAERVGHLVELGVRRQVLLRLVHDLRIWVFELFKYLMSISFVVVVVVVVECQSGTYILALLVESAQIAHLIVNALEHGDVLHLALQSLRTVVVDVALALFGVHQSGPVEASLL